MHNLKILEMFFQMKRYKKVTRIISLASLIMLISYSVKAEGPPAPSSISNSFVITMVIIMAILALAIALLANVVLGAASVQIEKEKEEEKKLKPTVAGTSAVVAGLLFLVSPLLAQNKASSVVSAGLAEGISPTAFYMMAGVIFLELMVILVLLYNLRLLLNMERSKKVAVEQAHAAVKAKPRLNWWDRFNEFKPIEQEVDIDLGHNYDGIRELDNRLPPWWLYGFYCSILFACIYLWRYHVSHSAPLSGEEYQIAMQQAAVQKEEYLKKAANNIDETNVKRLTSNSDLESGKNVFITVCAACHGKEGQGIVGPNLTDDYWLHGGSINDVFKTIKYGYPEKGMKSWKDDYSPSQLAQIASYVESLHGTNPLNPKAPQGTLYTIQNTTPAADSSINKTDSSKRASL
jgi:cytochrome c oxidase cbb3-type subunit III